MKENFAISISSSLFGDKIRSEYFDVDHTRA